MVAVEDTVMDQELLDILCCPVTHQPLRPATPEVLAQAAQKSELPLEEGLVREDGLMLYPIRNGIPLLLPEEGIAL